MASSFLDTRNGIGKNVSVQIQYENQKTVGQKDGLPYTVYFSKVPWLIKKTTWNYIGDESFWNDKIKELKDSYKIFSTSQTGLLLESVNIGERLIIDGVEYYSGTYTEAEYGSVVLTSPPFPLNSFETSTGSVSPNGYWGGKGPTGKAIFSSRYFAETGTRTYIAPDSSTSVGSGATIGGVSGLVSSVSKSNPRYIGETLVYDISESVTSILGSSIGF